MIIALSPYPPQAELVVIRENLQRYKNKKL